MNELCISFDQARARLAQGLAIATRLDHADGSGSDHAGHGLFGAHTGQWLDRMTQLVMRQQLVSVVEAKKVLTQDGSKLIEAASQAAVDAGCKVIQARLGIAQSELADQHFGVDEWGAMQDVFAGYLHAEVKELDVARAFEVNGKTRSLEDMLMTNSEDQETLEWLAKAVPGQFFKGIFCKENR